MDTSDCRSPLRRPGPARVARSSALAFPHAHAHALAFAFALACLSAAPARSAPVGLVPFEQDELWGYKDRAGRIVLPAIYLFAEEFGARQIAAVSIDPEKGGGEGGLAWIDAAGRVVARPMNYDNGADPFREGRARVVAGGQLGFIDERGRVVIAPRFEVVGPFSQGRAAFCSGCRLVRDGEHTTAQGGLWGYIDRAGKEIVPARYQAALEFEGGRARVQKAGAWIEIDRSGRERAAGQGRKGRR
jgi:hypothetical protein